MSDVYKNCPAFGLVPIHPNGLSGGQLTDNFQLAVIVPIMVWDWHAITRSCPMDSFFSIAGAFCKYCFMGTWQKHCPFFCVCPLYK